MIPNRYDVDPEKGLVFNKDGTVAGRVTSHGYVVVPFRRGRPIFAHRIVWEKANGPIPAGQMIDHINGIKTDNRIANLRLSTNSQNQMNRTALQGKVPFKGVTLHVTGKFQAQIKKGGKNHYLGLHDTAEGAAKAYAEAAKQLFGKFAAEARAAA